MAEGVAKHKTRVWRTRALYILVCRALHTLLSSVHVVIHLLHPLLVPLGACGPEGVEACGRVTAQRWGRRERPMYDTLYVGMAAP
eukprot:359845-Chlamydomonas_euryale.AAC.1